MWSTEASMSVFPDPFMDYASRVIPTDLRRALRFCQGLFYYNPLVRETARRVLSVFITEIELKGAERNKLDLDERDKHISFLDNKLRIHQTLQEFGLDFLAFGNAFLSFVVPPKRFLYCKKCHGDGMYTEYPIRTVLREPQFEFRWTIPKFSAVCPKCKVRTDWAHIDRRSNGDDAVLRRWSCQEIDIRYDEHRDYREYVWVIPATYRRKVKAGEPQVLESVPWEVVEAIRIDGNIVFEPGYVFHMYEPTLSGMDHQGWGIPRALVNARPAWLYQVLNRQNEAIALDYLTPMRWLSPDVGASTDADASDPLASIDMGNLKYVVEDAVMAHRRDPATFHFSPYPLKYTLMGGEAKQMAPVELLNYAADMLLNAMGFPSSLWRGELDQQTALPGLRMFQSYWTHLTRGLNMLLNWVCERTSEERGWDPVHASLVSPTLIDDVQTIMAKLQMAQSGDVSKTTAVRAIGADYRVELDQQADEERMKAKIQEQLQEEAERDGVLANIAAQQQQQAAATQGGDAGGGGGGGGGAAPAQGGAPTAAQSMPLLPNQKITPQELQGQAKQRAGEMMAMPDGQRQSEMQKLKSIDPTMHAAVRAEIDSLRQQAQTQGGNQLLAQTYGGGSQ